MSPKKPQKKGFFASKGVATTFVYMMGITTPNQE